MRKVIIAIIALAATGAAFTGYLLMTGGGSAPVQQTATTKDLPVQPKDIMPEKIGETIITVAQQSRYVILDPLTKELRRVLGFETLLNPGDQGSRWQVEKPYIEFHEPSYQCRIDSDKGTFTVDSTGPNASPTDAQLEGNVVIHILPGAESKMSETYIYMDDLVFSSERSEFSTDGPVRMVSDKSLLEGYGMILIFNTGTGQLDYLNIRDLDQLVLRDVTESDNTESTTSAAGKTPREAGSGTGGGRAERTQKESADQQAPAANRGSLYQCTLEDNVLIRYGEELVVAGAQNVSIQNIVLKSAQPTESGARIASGDRGRRQDRQPSRAATEPVEEPAIAEPAPAAAVADPNVPGAAGRDVIVTCDGGIILQPMANGSAATAPLSVQMNGSPLKIERTDPSKTDAGPTVVYCGRLEYKPQDDILKLFTNATQRLITLNTSAANSRIETQGDVWWNRKTRQANVGGPGKIFLTNADDPATEPSEVGFKGAMDLLFAEATDHGAGSAIERIDLTGGMDALLKQDGWYKTTAETAQLNFGPANSLSQAFLNGGVKFESLKSDNPQKATSKSAAFTFGPKNAISSAEMTGGVLFETRQQDNTSQAVAQKAVFSFDNSKIRTADLQGDVRFASNAGQMTSSNAVIDFSTDSAGVVQPGKVSTSGNAVLLAAVSSEKEPPAKFEAAKIDYDLLTRSGLAQGPVRFTFYQKAEAGSSSLEPWIPVVITADDNTRFLSDAKGNMEQVIFNKNVVAARTFKSFAYSQQDQFHGEKLTVYLGPSEDGRRGISSIRMSEGKVFGESVRTQNEAKLSHVKLNCTDMAWSRSENLITATGPGDIKLDNSHAAPADASATGGSALYQRPGYALVSGFNTLRWDLAAQTLTTDGNADTLQMAYVPVVNGAPEKFLYANSIRFEMFFTKDAAGRIVLKRAFTGQGIAFKEMNADQSQTLNEMVGQSLDYNPIEGNGWLKIAGSPAVPCFLNGVRVPSVFVNVDTGKIETSLSTVPGVYLK